MDDNFPDNFRLYVKKELHCLHIERHHGIHAWIFWSRQDDQCERPPASCSRRTDLAFKTPISSPQITEKIKSLFRDSIFLPGQILVQYWKAIEIGGRRLLTTRGQPFSLSTTHGGLCSYRLISLDYEIYVDGEEGDEEELGLPGRVFRRRQMESTPNVKYYSSKEYPQRDLTLLCNVRGSLALPVFEPSGSCCVGVLELVTPERNFLFNSFTFKLSICRELEVVGLKCLETCSHLYGQNKDKDEALEGALAEIREVLQVVCRTHCLPLAQTWVLCRLCNAVFVGRSFNSRIDTACYWEIDKFPFSDACASHHLLKGQGVVGRAFSSYNLVFCEDITRFSITEYPLAHYAHEYGLTGCFAICLQSSYTGDDVYAIELFLPPSNTEGGDLSTTLVSLFVTMRQHFKSLKVVSREELGEELSIEVIDISKVDELDSFQKPQTARSPDRPKTLENGRGTVQLGLPKQQVMEVDAVHTGNNAVSTTDKNNIAIISSQQKCINNSSQRQHRRKSGIPITLEDIQQHFGMKLEDSAESLGVSRSTLKRACREYQITWWPSRKRNKDNHSIPNESAQCAAQEQIQVPSPPPISGPPRKKDRTTAASTKPHLMAVEDATNVTIKAKYKDDFIKFQLPVSSGMAEFHRQVVKRLNLKVGTYSVKYEDVDNDWILLSCDEDLQNYISNSISAGVNTVTMSLQPMATCPL